MSTTTLIRLPDVCSRVGLGRTAIRDRVSRKEFPAPVKLGSADNAPIAWVAAEIDDWIAAQIAKPRVQMAAPNKPTAQAAA